tara:strand:- start:8 stop:112 length:105 start_codon:yes stop_codon:yes gene_type:complete
MLKEFATTTAFLVARGIARRRPKKKTFWNDIEKE